ncbi:hypothetical protein CHH83_02340 [Bacillus sp. 7586-K]|nr:hypothetical protein CHH83_02340 [Bacillus sp. 7586-K]
MSLITGTDWYDEASKSFIKWVEDHSVEPFYEFENIKHEQDNDIRFHFDGGMWIRNLLRELGYTDDIYGNLDDHYQHIIKIVFDKVGL